MIKRKKMMMMKALGLIFFRESVFKPILIADLVFSCLNGMIIASIYMFALKISNRNLLWLIIEFL